MDDDLRGRGTPTSVGDITRGVADAVARSSLVERLAGLVGMNANASAVFGDPIVADGVTVIPVAKARWGFGGGSGGDGREEGSGGGGGGVVAPMGYIELRDGGARFTPIHSNVLGAARAGVVAAITAIAATFIVTRRVGRKTSAIGRRTLRSR